MIDAPEGYKFTVDYETVQRYSWSSGIPHVIIRLWKIGNQTSGVVAAKEIKLLGMSEQEIVNVVENSAEQMLTDLSMENHFRGIVRRHWS